ncbi:MAG: 3-oxoacyl-ACP reductase family protein [Candidatus Firestonebacteria bacterium]
MKLKNKIALVTGGSRGIGRTIALGLAKEGANVVVNYVSHDKNANQVVKEIKKIGGKAIAIKADVSKQDEVIQMVEKVIDEFKRIDILVNNAGIGHFKSFFEITEDLWDWVLNVNLKSVFLVSQAVAKVMAKQKGGKIINITSISGEKATHPDQTVYCTSKAGANMLTKTMALALSKYNINVNAVLPGTIETDINREGLSKNGVKQHIIKNTPLRRLGIPKDVVGTVVLLASSESDWITGTLIPVDGGFII